MKAVRFRVRTMVVGVGVVALLVWGGMMGVRAYEYGSRAREYRAYERGWRQIAARGGTQREFNLECAEYYNGLAEKYRRAMWRPWRRVAPDPYAPGVREYLEQERREGRGAGQP